MSNGAKLGMCFNQACAFVRQKRVEGTAAKTLTDNEVALVQDITKQLYALSNKIEGDLNEWR